MKKFALLVVVVAFAATLPTIGGCGKSETVVVEAPEEAFEEEPAMEGMSDDDYDDAMEASLNE